MRLYKDFDPIITETVSALERTRICESKQKIIDRALDWSIERKITLEIQWIDHYHEDWYLPKHAIRAWYEVDDDLIRAEDLECIVCQDFILAPMVLNCGHSYCMCCLTKLVEIKNSKCPYCRVDFEEVFFNRCLSSIIDKYCTSYGIHSRIMTLQDEKTANSYPKEFRSIL